MSPLTGLAINHNGGAINISPLRGFVLTAYCHLPTAYRL